VAYINSINLYFLSTLIALLSTVALLSFIFIRFIVLSPIYQLVRSIKLTKKRGEPVVSHYRSKDQLGVLTRVYNELIIDNDKQQQQLKAERARSEQALQAKQQFLAMMTHELRTPLNGVIGMSEQLATLVDQPKQQKYVEVIQLSAQQLLAIINDTLDFSKIEADKLELDIQPLDIVDTISSVIMMFEHKEDKKAVKLNFCSLGRSIQILEGDSTRIIQIVINLLGNAMKFTKQGHVDVTLAVVSQTTQDISLTISVSDTGIGLSAEQISALFTEFSQADSSTTRQYGGTGLGLWISKKLVEKMDGEITVTGELGQGAEFVVHLTLDKSEVLTLETPTKAKPILIKPILTESALATDDEIAEKNTSLAGAAEILLVEDTEINRMVVTAILGDPKLYSFDIAVNGLEAVNLYRQRLASGERPYDLILMDCLMPVMDGFEASQAIREIEQLSDADLHTPIIALTANALDKVKEQCITAGMDEFLTKPVESGVLIGTVDKWLKDQRQVVEESIV
jgi:signal transduction histidine kinase/AmiR/NasT family two-component response regulator